VSSAGGQAGAGTIAEEDLGMGKLGHLVYASAATAGFTVADLDEILRVARERNSRLGVSGILLFEGTSFLQVLEGEPDTIDPLFREIGKDKRHGRVVLLIREPVDDRSFASWTMGYSRIDRGELADITGAHAFYEEGETLPALTDTTARTIIDKFRSGAFRQRIS
jgi:hypothetical protein